MPSDYKAITEHNEEQLGKDTSSRKTQVSMYSDSTHFVYEILQNADDHGATEVFFKLSKNEIMIEHNGEQFNEKHVKAITYFGKGTSREDLLKTGRFGIGFKSVFAFTATPIIISWPEHFQIYGLYRVRDYPYPEDFSNCRTRIILPFNHESEHPDFVEELMTQEEAYRQISECLPKLNMNTLLFTQNIREISWKIGNRSMRFWRDDEEDGNARLTIIRNSVQEKGYLVFSKVPTWKNEKHKAVEIAFAIDGQHQITSIEDDNLFVLFPTTEKTGLRFLLNGPYHTTPARENILKTDAFNNHLMHVTCELMKEALTKIREKKRLTMQFLAILPIKEDSLSCFCDPLQSTIIDAFQNKKLTPTKRGDHAAASELYRVNSELFDLISDSDLSVLLSEDSSSPLIVNDLPRQRDDRGRFVQDPNAQRRDSFLAMLQIPDWGINELIDALIDQPKVIENWLKNKSVEDHKILYELLYDFLKIYWNGNSWYSSNSRHRMLSNLSIVRCSDNAYRPGRKCFFPSNEIEHDECFPRVVKGMFSLGRNLDQRSKARDFLESINVRTVDESVEIEAILKKRYIKGTIKLRKPHYKQDLERFIQFIEGEEQGDPSLFKDYHIFESDDKSWGIPSIFFLDLPYLKTSLTVYHEILESNSKSRKRVISSKYAKYGIDLERLTKFAQAVGVQTKLEVIPQESIPTDHPEYYDLVTSAPGQYRHNTSVREDYTISELSCLLSMPLRHKKQGNIDKALDTAKLIWQTMCSQPHDCLKARYRNNASHPIRFGLSSLVHALRKAKWVPQNGDETISFARPQNASDDKLPKDFPMPKGYPDDAGDEWLNAIEFGKKAKEQREEYDQRDQQARNEGYSSLEEKEKSVELAQLLRQKGKPIDDIIFEYSSQNSETNPDFPTSPVRNSELREKRVLEQIRNAPHKIYEERIRNERVTKYEINQRETLQQWYTNHDSDAKEMVCQICKEEMPFKKTDGDYYFLAIEALTIRFKEDELPEKHFPKEYGAQYLALCPECAAKYLYFVRSVKEGGKVMEELRNHIMNSEDLDFPLKLGELETSIRFVEAHLHDLKKVLRYYESPDEVEDSTD